MRTFLLQKNKRSCGKCGFKISFAGNSRIFCRFLCSFNRLHETCSGLTLSHAVGQNGSLSLQGIVPGYARIEARKQGNSRRASPATCSCSKLFCCCSSQCGLPSLYDWAGARWKASRAPLYEPTYTMPSTIAGEERAKSPA